MVVSTVDVGAVGLGSNILYQTYLVCVKETSYRTVIEYGKSRGSAEDGDVFLTMIDDKNPLFVRFYSFGNGEDPLDIVDAHIVLRSQMKATCKGDTSLDVVSNMCLQSCHPLCDPDRGLSHVFSVELFYNIPTREVPYFLLHSCYRTHNNLWFLKPLRLKHKLFIELIVVILSGTNYNSALACCNI